MFTYLDASNRVQTLSKLTLRAFERVHVLGVNAKDETHYANYWVSTCGDQRVDLPKPKTRF